MAPARLMAAPSSFFKASQENRRKMAAETPEPGSVAPRLTAGIFDACGNRHESAKNGEGDQ
jgi:hypothetical protein